MIKRVFLTGLILILSGCTTSTPPMTEYRIQTDILDKKRDNLSSCINDSIKVSQAFSSTPLMSLKMNYAHGQYKQFSYSESQWTESPNNAITDAIVQLLKSTNNFKSVQVAKSRSKTSLILETSIEDFMQYFSEDLKESYAVVKINLTIIEAESSRVIHTRSLRSKVNVDTLDAKGGVKALNSALKDVLHKSAMFFDEVCR